MSDKTPIESTIIYRDVSRSLPWARLYICLAEIWDKNMYSLTSADVAKLTEYRIKRSYAWQLLDELCERGILKKTKQSGKKGHNVALYHLFESLFIEKEKVLDRARKTIEEKGE